MKFRFTFLIGGTTLVFLLLGYNIYSLQIRNGAAGVVGTHPHMRPAIVDIRIAVADGKRALNAGFGLRLAAQMQFIHGHVQVQARLPIHRLRRPR